MRLYWRSKKPFPIDILIKHEVSEDGVSLISEMMRPNPTDRMTVTITLLHSWVPIQEPTPTPEDLDSFNDSQKYELEGQSADEFSSTESCKCIPLTILKCNSEYNQPFLNLAITSHTTNRKIPDEDQTHLPSNSYLTSSQTEDIMQLQK